MAPNSGAGDIPPHVQRLLASVAGEKGKVCFFVDPLSYLKRTLITIVTGRQLGWRIRRSPGGDRHEESEAGVR